MTPFHKAFFLVFFVFGSIACLSAYKQAPVLGVSFAGEAGQPMFVVRVEVDGGSRGGEKGTGTLVRSDLVLTCHHVIRDARATDKIVVIFRSGMKRQAEVIKSDRAQDLALLRIEPVLVQAARPARRSVIKDQDVVVCGFPKGGDYDEVRGRVVDFNSPTRDGEETLFTVNNKCQSGMSGGPVLNMSGEVVGVLFGTLRFAHCTGLSAIENFLDGV